MCPAGLGYCAMVMPKTGPASRYTSTETSSTPNRFSASPVLAICDIGTHPLL